MRYIAKSGPRRGENHHRAVLTNREVEQMRELRGEGWTYARLAETFECSKSLVQHICTERKRIWG